MTVMTTSLEENMKYLNRRLAVSESFDLVYRVIKVGERNACIYFIDGFCKDELMQKMLVGICFSIAGFCAKLPLENTSIQNRLTIWNICFIIVAILLP